MWFALPVGGHSGAVSDLQTLWVGFSHLFIMIDGPDLQGLECHIMLKLKSALLVLGYSCGGYSSWGGSVQCAECDFVNVRTSNVPTQYFWLSTINLPCLKQTRMHFPPEASTTIALAHTGWQASKQSLHAVMNTTRHHSQSVSYCFKRNWSYKLGRVSLTHHCPEWEEEKKGGIMSRKQFNNKVWSDRFSRDIFADNLTTLGFVHEERCEHLVIITRLEQSSASDFGGELDISKLPLVHYLPVYLHTIQTNVQKCCFHTFWKTVLPDFSRLWAFG